MFKNNPLKMCTNQTRQKQNENKPTWSPHTDSEKNHKQANKQIPVMNSFLMGFHFKHLLCIRMDKSLIRRRSKLNMCTNKFISSTKQMGQKITPDIDNWTSGIFHHP